MPSTSWVSSGRIPANACSMPRMPIGPNEYGENARMQADRSCALHNLLPSVRKPTMPPRRDRWRHVLRSQRPRAFTRARSPAPIPPLPGPPCWHRHRTSLASERWLRNHSRTPDLTGTRFRLTASSAGCSVSVCTQPLDRVPTRRPARPDLGPTETGRPPVSRLAAAERFHRGFIRLRDHEPARHRARV